MHKTFSLDVWCDFPLENFHRAMFAMPIKRKNALATVFDGTLKTVSEKSLSTAYLSLTERVTYRRRVMLFSNDRRGAVVYPTWDFNGPDLSYFGEWKSSRACPWVIDGRKLVADAKDRVLQMVEAAKARGLKRLLIYDGIPHTLTLTRGWELGSVPWLAFWAGVRKAAEVAGMEIVAVTDHNPYEDIASPVAWTKEVDIEDGDVACHPCDVFSSFVYDTKVGTILMRLFADAPPIEYLFSWIPVFPYTSTLHTKHRNAHWNP